MTQHGHEQVGLIGSSRLHDVGDQPECRRVIDRNAPPCRHFRPLPLYDEKEHAYARDPLLMMIVRIARASIRRRVALAFSEAIRFASLIPAWLA